MTKFPDYRAHFVDAAAASTAIRSRVDGTSEYIPGMRAGGPDPDLSNTAAAVPTPTFDPFTPG